MKFKPCEKPKGNLLVFTVFIALAIAVLILSIAGTMKQNAVNQHFLDQITKTYLLGETATNEALAQVSRNSSILADPTFYEWKEPAHLQYNNVKQRYQVDVKQLNFPDPITGNPRNGFYVKTQAERTLSGKTFRKQTHTYAVTSNVADYFLASKTSIRISTGINASEGKIYGSSLVFLLDGILDAGGMTRLKGADYFYQCTSSNTSTQIVTPCDTTDFSNEVFLELPVGIQKPVKLNNELVFPQLLDADYNFYRSKALYSASNPHAGHYKPTACSFSGHVYPPGYSGSILAGDTYGNHTSNNDEHVYFCEGDIFLHNVTVHGQVLFVSTGNIHIRGNLLQHNTDTYAVDEINSNRPGTGLGASRAHQAVLITRRNIILNADPTYFLTTTDVATITIQGMLFVPEGEVIAEEYTDPAYHKRLKLKFSGAWITRNMNVSIPRVFNSNELGVPPTPARTYQYMTSLRTHPPPDLPNLAEVFYVFEDKVD